ncbi:MAG: ABC transporter ATP-binding protein [bacterium]
MMHLKLSNLKKSFFSFRGEVTALHEINLDIHDREFFILLGPSGCGKSTLLNLMAGLEKPSRGEIYFGDTVVASKEKKVFLSPKERNVSFVFQSYALYPHLTVFENIAFPLKVVGTKVQVIKESVHKTASTLEISDLLSAKPAELSGGQRQRVAIARAIVRQPNLFLLDEPLSNLDAQLRTAMRAELKNLQHRLGITTVYVTHDQVEAMSLGDRIAVLRKGRIEQVDTPQDLYDHPKNTFVAQFIGAPTMNLIKASLIEEQGQTFIAIGREKIKVPEGKIPHLQKLPSSSFLLGIRPEHISLSPLPAKSPLMTPVVRSDLLPGKIISTEPLGKETIFHIDVEGQKILGCNPDQIASEGERCAVAFALKKCHIFQKDD